MKTVIAIFVVLSAASCVIARPQEEVQLHQFINDNNVDGAYKFAYEQSDRQQIAGAEEPSLAVKVSYEYTDPTGQRYRVEYVADEKGYHPTVTKL